MTTIEIRDIPPDVERTLRRRAAEARQSLEEYLLALLVAAGRKPTLQEVLERVSRRSGGTLSLVDAARTVRTDREADGGL